MSAIINHITAQNKNKNDYKIDELKGNVCIVKSLYYDYKKKYNEELNDKPYSSLIEEYNKSGFKIKTTRYDDMNVIKQIIENKYDSANNILQSNTQIKEKDYQETSIITFEYDSLRRCIQINQFSEDTILVFKTINRYSSNNTLQETIIYNSEGIVYKKSIYNENELVINIKGFDTYGNQKYNEDLKYDSNGNEIETIFKKNDSEIIETKLNYYNNLNQITESVCNSTNNGLCYTYNYKYDKSGNMIVHKSFSKSEMYNYYIEIFYQYDDQGNWIQRKQKNNPAYFARPFVIREITYY